MGTTENGEPACFRLPSRLPTLLIYFPAYCTLLGLVAQKLSGTPVLVMVVFGTPFAIVLMRVTYGRNYLVADAGGIRARTLVKKYSFTWDELDRVMWSDVLIEQMSYVHVLLKNAHPIEPAVTICSVAPVGFFVERKRLARELKLCCEQHGVDMTIN